jgi:3'(2'), 5'-bisphosphate nucleotidase
VTVADRPEHADAVRLARAAGHLLIRLRAQPREADGLGRAADAGADRLLVDRLRTLYPCDPVLSEETPDDGRRLATDRVWVVDPLDGTREFCEPGRDDWAVHVALVIDRTPVAAAVALPAQQRLLSTLDPPHPPAANGDRIRIVVSRTRPPALAVAVAERLGAELIPMGSAGAKAMAVVLGRADVYLHAGGQYEWDSAAPVGVARAAGLHASRLDGSPLLYNNPSPWVPDLLVSRPELADSVLDVIRQVSDADRPSGATPTLKGNLTP